MATPRTTVADQIKLDNASFIVADFPTLPDNLSRGQVHVAIWRTDVKSVPDTPNALEHPLTIQVVVPVTSGAIAENAADDALDAVLLSLQRIEGLSWSLAERSNFDEAFVGYQITASVFSSNVYRTAVLESN